MNRAGRFLMWVGFGIVMIAVVTFVTQQLWNWVVPAVFNGPVIDFWHTLGLLVLSKILFSGFGRNCSSGNQNPWKQKIHDKFSGMTPAERDAFKKKMWEKWCPNQNRPPADCEEEPKEW